MARLDLNSELLAQLLQMIDQVIVAPDERTASVALLFPLLCLFDMDQAAFCELRDEEVVPLFAMDRTKRILSSEHRLWLSRTLMEQALQSMEPALHSDGTELAQAVPQAVPKSISEYSLKNVVCIPISSSPARVVYLASQRYPRQNFSEPELINFKIAARAACLALQQHKNFSELRDSNEKLQLALQEREGHCLHASPAMTRLMEEVARLAPFDISIVLLGESGVGKEVVAREIHRLSRRPGPFVAINCANLTETLLESELFGYARGAFTGAFAAKKGLLQEAQEGTFFLDEVAEIPLNLQAKLLRVLQEKQIRPLGMTRDLPIDVRILAASHRCLKQEVEEGRFREDLFYRLQQMAISIPPLRERKEDVELLAQHFTARFAQEFHLPERSLGPEAVEKTLAYPWPGNVRELQNVCRTAVILSRGNVVAAEDLRLPAPARHETPGEADTSGSLRERSSRYEQTLIRGLLDEPGENQASVAKKLDISVRTLQRILNKEAEIN